MGKEEVEFSTESESPVDESLPETVEEEEIPTDSTDEDKVEEGGLPHGIEMEVGFELDSDDDSDEVTSVWESAAMETESELSEDEGTFTSPEDEKDETIAPYEVDEFEEETIDESEDSLSPGDEEIDVEDEDEPRPSIKPEMFEELPADVEVETNDDISTLEVEDTELVDEDLLVASLASVAGEINEVEDDVSDENSVGSTILSLDSTEANDIQLGQPESKGGGSFSIPIIINKDEVCIEMRLNLSLDIEKIKGKIVENISQADEMRKKENDSSRGDLIKEDNSLLSQDVSPPDVDYDNQFSEQSNDSSMDVSGDDDGMMIESDLDTSFLDEVIDVNDDASATSDEMDELDDERWVVEERGAKEKKRFSVKSYQEKTCSKALINLLE